MRRFLLATIIVIAYWCLYPWQFNFAGIHTNPFLILIHSWPERWDHSTFRDALVNVELYVPLGAVAFLAMAQRWRNRVAMAAALAIALTTSACVEMLQAYVPQRVCSMADLLFNLAGAAAGILIAWRLQPRSNAAAEAISRNSAAVLLLGSWGFYHFAMFYPSLSLTRLLFEFHVLLHPPPFTALDVGINAAEWFAVALAVQSIFKRMRPWWLLSVIVLRVAVRPILITRPLSMAEVLGLIAALLLWRLIPERKRLPAALWLLGAAIVAGDLSTFRFSEVPADFSWMPFRQELEAGAANIAVVLRKVFDYSAAVWLLRRAGLTYWNAGLLLAIALAVLEYIQRFSFGKTPGLTDSALAALLAMGLWASEQITTPVAPYLKRQPR